MLVLYRAKPFLCVYKFRKLLHGFRRYEGVYLLRYFLVKRKYFIVGMSGVCFEWVLGGWTDVRVLDQSDWSFYGQPIQLLLATVAISVSMCGFLLMSAKHCFKTMAEKPLSFGSASHGIMRIEIESMNWYIFSGRKGVFEWAFLLWVLWRYLQKALKPVKMLPWGRTSQRWLVLAKWCFQQSMYGNTNKSSPHSRWVVPCCFTLDPGNWNYDPIFFLKERCFQIWPLYCGNTNRNLKISEIVSLRRNEQTLSSLKVSGHFSVDSDQTVYFLLRYITNLIFK